MSINRKNIISNYTIVEVMVAMGIFLIMMTIMMQFFTSAQKVWNASAKRNMIYADARVAMNIMTREIQTMLFKNETASSSNIYPFFFEWTDITTNGKLKTYFEETDELSEKSSGDCYLTAINFIATTDLKSIDMGSDVCEVRYRFVPVSFDTTTPTSIQNVTGGKLERSCTAEYYSLTQKTNAFKPATAPDGSKTGPYNYSTYYYRGDVSTLQGLTAPENDMTYQNRVATIWGNTADDLEAAPFKTVITGVYSLQFTCYIWDTSGKQLIELRPMNRTAPGKDQNGTNLTTDPLKYDLATGTPFPVAVRIDMKLMDPKDLKQLALNIYRWKNNDDKEAEQQVKTLKQRIRTFSKVIYLGQK